MRIGDRDGEPYPEICGRSRRPRDGRRPDDAAGREARAPRRTGFQSNSTSEAFNLVTGPLAKVLFVRLSPTDNLITFSMHHIVADGWSSSILLRELGAVYSAIIEGEASPTCFPCPISMSTMPRGRPRKFTTVCSSGSSAIGEKSWPALRRCWTFRRIAVGPCSAHSVAIASIVLSRRMWCCDCSNSANVMTPRSS